MPGENALITQGDQQTVLKGGVLGCFICGGLAGALSRTCTAPLDRIKVILQVQGCKSQTILGQTEELGARGVLRKMIAEGGGRSLWRGNMINCCKIVPENGLRLALFELLQLYIPHSRDNLYTKFACGALTGAVVQTTMFPIELIKTRVMLQSSENRMPIRAIFQSLGSTNLLRFKGCFRGLTPALIGIIPFSGIELAANKTISQWWAARSGNKYPDMFAAGVIGTCCTVSAAFSTYPAKLLTTRQQAYKGDPPIKTMQLMREILQQEKMRGLWRGFIPNAMKIAPSTFVSWGSYYYLMASWERTFTRKHPKHY